MNINKRQLVIGLTALIGVLIVGVAYKSCSSSTATSTTAASAPTAKKPLYWIDPMEPTVRYPGPGKSRMGMTLVPVYPDNQQSSVDPATISVSPTLINNLGVRTAPVVQASLAKQITTVGYIEPNENKISHIHPYADGWVQKLIVKAVGDQVKKGQLLFQFYSPQLVNAQDEFLIALQSNDQRLIDASYKKLQFLQVSEQQIQQLKKTRKTSQLIDVYAPQDGIVTALNVREGMRVTPDTDVMSLADLSTVWMIAQIYENQADWVQIGQQAQATFSAFPGRVWQGVVEYIYPQLDATTRTVKVRFRFDNPNNTLKPNMYADVSIFAQPKPNVLNIPLEALIRTSQKNYVIVALGDGKFQARSVVVGMESGERVEIISGLKLGENVVTSGQFLIDSEVNLKAAMQRLDTTASDTLLTGQGTIVNINSAQKMLTLKHEAIPSLNLPAMTMDLSVANNVALQGLKAGDAIQFNITKMQDGQLMIVQIKPLTNATGTK